MVSQKAPQSGGRRGGRRRLKSGEAEEAGGSFHGAKDAGQQVGAFRTGFDGDEILI